MKLFVTLASILTVYSSTVHAAPGNLERVRIRHSVGIQNASATGEEVRLISGHFEGHWKGGGAFGEYIDDWKLVLQVTVQEISYEKKFGLRDLVTEKITWLSFNENSQEGTVRYLGRLEEENERGIYLVTTALNNSSAITPQHDYELIVQMGKSTYGLTLSGSSHTQLK